MAFVERLTVDAETKATLLYTEHSVRYQLASQMVKDKVVLDVACGSGYGTEVLLQAGAQKVIGVDIDEIVIKAAQQRYSDSRIEFMAAEATTLPLPDKSIDLITSFETIEHLSDCAAYLKEMKRVLKGEGVALISTPNRDVFGQKNPFHIKEFTKIEFTELLSSYFQNVTILEQKNGLASVIVAGEGTESIEVSDKSDALYFLAVCSDQVVATTLKTVTEINIPALKRWEQNPGWRLVNWVYALGQKLKLLK